MADSYEIAGFPNSKWDSGDFVGYSCRKVAWADRVELLADIDSGSLKTWPYADGPSQAVARKVKIEPLGGRKAKIEADATLGSEFGSYDYALMTIEYSTKGYEYLGGVMYLEEMQPSAIAVNGNPKALEWTDGTVLTEYDAAPYYLPTCSIRRTWPKTLTISSWVVNHVGYCNAGPWTAPLLGVTFAAQRLLMGSPRIIRSYTLGKLPAYSVSVQYDYMPSGWNTLFRSATGQFEAVRFAGGDYYTPYPTVSFGLHF